MFDKALEKLHAQKASIKDLRNVQLELSENRASSLFADMRDLFDVAVKGINEKILEVEESCEKKLKSIDTKYLEMV